MEHALILQAIQDNQVYLGIELGSTRIKAVLIAPDMTPIAQGSYNWENRLENGIWTYHLEEVWQGLRSCYKMLAAEVLQKFGVALQSVGAMGVSAMMHGYLVFDAQDNLLVPFRTWRNTITKDAAARLTELFGFNIPQRWNIAHLYQAILNAEPHVASVCHLTTLAGYVHWQLTGQKVFGVGEASGVFPIDHAAGDFDATMVRQFDELLVANSMPYALRQILPRILSAGENAGTLTPKGAQLLDPTGVLQPGIRFCPPEGDAGTGMVATNSVREKTGNISAGTSIFAMAVLENPLSQVYLEVDMVATPGGKPVAIDRKSTRLNSSHT